MHTHIPVVFVLLAFYSLLLICYSPLKKNVWDIHSFILKTYNIYVCAVKKLEVNETLNVNRKQSGNTCSYNNKNDCFTAIIQVNLR